MGLTINRLKTSKEATMPNWKADKRYYADKDNNLVPENSPNADHLVISEGGELTEEDQQKYGLGPYAKHATKDEKAATRQEAGVGKAQQGSGRQGKGKGKVTDKAVRGPKDTKETGADAEDTEVEEPEADEAEDTEASAG